MWYGIYIIFILFFGKCAYQQKVAPGVNPKIYQNQQQQKQFGQSQYQPPPQHYAKHDQYHQQPNILDKSKIVDEKEHIQHHAEVPMDMNKMSEQELQFHYFKMYDVDNNSKLDGSELIKSLIHWHDENKNQGVEMKIFSESELESMIDPILTQDDKNNDGYVDFAEFMVAQQNAASNKLFDPIMDAADFNKDGYIDFAEYKLAAQI